MAFEIRGPQEWNMTRDPEGHREYNLISLVVSEDYEDGPAQALVTPGLPLPGAPWVIGNDVDFWAWCRWDARITPIVTNEPNKWFRVENKFGTKPLPRDQQRPNDTPVENPLMEPPKVSGSFIKVSEEASRNRFGQPLFNSAWELMRGPQTEFDVTRSTVRIEQNFASLNYPLQEAMMNCVNDSILWGHAPRTIKLSGITWERKFHGFNQIYYTRVLDFEINRLGWDRILLDEGTKVLHGHWHPTTGAWVLDNIDGVAPSPFNPTHFMRAIDRQGNPASIILNGRGVPASTVILNPTDVANLGKLWISIVDSNQGNALTNTTYWLEQSRVGLDSAYTDNLTYPVGSLLFYDDNQFYIALTENTNVSPTGNPTRWRLLGSITDKGSYSASTSYSIGNRVESALVAPTGIGQRFVSKYNGANFLILSIPIFF